MKRYITATFVAASLLLGNASSRTVQATAYTMGYITATSKQARVGQVALSRDLLRIIPYGSIITFSYPRGKGCGGWNTGPLIVEDTMHPRIFNTIDVRMNTDRAAFTWGRCVGYLKVIRYGR